MGVGSVLDIARTALIAQRAAIEVIGHNVANADTEGYSRQRVVMSPKQPLLLGGVIMGTGVDLATVERAYNRFANMNIDKQTSTLSDLSTRQEYLAVLETAFNELSAGGGLGDRLSAFFAGWQDVANNPAGQAERLTLLEQGGELAGMLQTQAQGLDDMSGELRQQVIQTVDEINDRLSQVAELNNQILGAEVNGSTANDLRDQRDQLLNQLSQDVGINYFEQPNGQVTVFAAGRLMVDGGNAYSFDTASAGGDNVAITWHGSLPGTEDISSQLEGGKLGGYLTLLQDTVPGYRQQLNEWAGAVIYEVNRLHSQGVGESAATAMTGNQRATDAGAALTDAASGLAFGGRIDDSGTAGFKVHLYDASGNPLVAGGETITITAGMSLNDLAAALDAVTGLSATVSDGCLQVSAASGEGATSFAVSDDTSGVLAAVGLNCFFSGSDAGSIAVSATADQIAAGRVQADSTFAVGDGSNALAIADLEDAWVSVGGTNETLGGSLAALVGSIGVESAALQRNQEFRQATLDQLTSQRDSETGVSLDEELSNMLAFQHAYTAAARILQVADEMLKTLVEIKS